MTITQNVASKLVVSFVAVSMLFTLSFAPAQAATADELQAQINALLAQIASLQGSTSGGSTSCAAFTMDLTMGASGAEVTALQNFLIGKGHAIAAGATGYFGGQTQAALAAYQTAAGISPAAGYFGPITRAKVNADCTPSSSDDDANDDDANDDDSSSDDLSGEASLDSDDLNDGEDTDVEEGQEDAPVAEYDVEFADGDARITRLDVTFVASGTEEDAWDTFEDISLWVDGEEVARQSASDEDDYLDEDDGSIRFSGLDIVAMEDEELTIVIGATVQGSVDNVPATWNVDVTGLRFVDGDDVASTETITVDSVSFDIDEEGGDDELIVKSSDEDPDATTLALKDDARSDWQTVFAFRLDSDDSTNDITVNNIPVGFEVSSGTVATFINDIKLVVDGEEFDDYTGSTTNSDNAYYDFDIDGDLVIDAGEEVTVEVMVEFKELAAGNEGVTIEGNATGTSMDAEGADDLTSSQLSGTASGETHTMRTEGVDLAAGDMSEERETNSDSSTTDDQGVFTLKFDVTAFETDVYINKSGSKSSSTVVTSAGVHYIVTDGSGTEVNATGTISASLSSTADTDGTRYVVDEGETETFTLTVTYDPGVTGFYGVQLFGVNFNDTNGDGDTQQRALPAADYETDPISVSH